jgi:hypothetical protein
VTANFETEEASVLNFSESCYCSSEFWNMSHPASSDGEAVASTTLDEKASTAVNEKHSAEPVTNISALTDLQIFDIDAVELPDGYFRSPFFIGTVAATGLAIMSVSTPRKAFKRT